MRCCLFALAPQFGHVFQSFTLGFRYQLPYEDGSNDADDAIEAVCEPVAEVVAFSEVHVEHRHKGAGHDEVENPLESHSDGNGAATDGVGEDLSNEHPCDGTPREHE